MHILGLPTDIFNVYPASIKFKTYQARWQIGDIYVSGGCYLVMTGRGCDDIFRILDSRNYTFGDMFKHCERRYGLDNFHFTRLDIAIDDKNEKPFFTIEQIKKKCEKDEGYHFDESKFDDFDTAKTVYIGAGKSGLSYRFYDKDKEVCSKHNKTLDEVG
ncbi:replication initiation factor domain-containing protein, partial [[Eubacterium] hominis]|uniref:replication initiation factor domain-containing protein n=1 Tax=[Eubacterium] hominis TaxID=2764325 RepID=UPI0023DD6CAF